MSLRRVRLWAIATAVGLVFLPTLGCSWIFVNEPPKGPIDVAARVECTSSNVAPIVDTVVAGLYAVTGTVFLVGGIVGSKENGAGSVIGFGAVTIVAAAPFAVSTAYGYRTTAECRHLKEAQLSCTSGVEEACRTLQERKPK